MRFSEDTTKTEEDAEEKDRIIFAPPEPKLRTVGIMGEINEEGSAEVVFGLLSLQNSAVHYEPVDVEDEESDVKEVIMPIEMVISTPGGNADDMFAIYDTMRMIRSLLVPCWGRPLILQFGLGTNQFII